MKAVTRHSLELCLSASELLELCSSEDLRDIPRGLAPTLRAVRFDEGSPMMTVTLAFVPAEPSTHDEAVRDSEPPAAAPPLDAAAGVSYQRPRRKRS